MNYEFASEREQAWAALRMTRDAVQELFGPIANLPSEEGVLHAAPEFIHEAEAQVAALMRIKERMKEFRDFIEDIADTQWQADEPNDRGALGEDWGAYIGEMEGFCNHVTDRARKIMFKPMTPKERGEWKDYLNRMMETAKDRGDRDFEGLALACMGLLAMIR